MESTKGMLGNVEDGMMSSDVGVSSGSLKEKREQEGMRSEKGRPTSFGNTDSIHLYQILANQI